MKSTPPPPPPLSAYLPALTYFTWAVALLWLLDENHFQAFLLPQLAPLLVLALGICLLLTVVCMRRAQREVAPAKTKNVVQKCLHAAILLLPLCALWPAQSIALGDIAYQSHFAYFLPDEGGISEEASLPDENTVLNVMELLQLASALEGRTVMVRGKLRKGSWQDNADFDLYQFVIFCCAADAQPASIPVCSDLPNDEKVGPWVEIRGRLHIEEKEGGVFRYLEAESIYTVETPPPHKQYLYASFW